ncbi:uncharacterized protein G2W53_016295 [Senna tora]|uniref:Uncharacterized protein n=1 Tax=Senna tora TaxID=362788 RepID=A0A834TQ97_9FABA|nr:uncharacterized protein G2W53_016295 [Senna tora]
MVSSSSNSRARRPEYTAFAGKENVVNLAPMALSSSSSSSSVTTQQNSFSSCSFGSLRGGTSITWTSASIMYSTVFTMRSSDSTEEIKDSLVEVSASLVVVPFV